MLSFSTSFQSLHLVVQCILAQLSSSTSIPRIPSTSTTIVTGASGNASGKLRVRSVSGMQSLTMTSSPMAQDATAVTTPSQSSGPTNGTALATSFVWPRPWSARPYNGHVEFCERKFSNISMVVAHNSPFVRSHNIASNQLYGVVSQLNDGVRGCTFNIRKRNGNTLLTI